MAIAGSPMSQVSVLQRFQWLLSPPQAQFEMPGSNAIDAFRMVARRRFVNVNSTDHK
jgi:hypothetical protein